jgi:hypothetical protein
MDFPGKMRIFADNEMPEDGPFGEEEKQLMGLQMRKRIAMGRLALMSASGWMHCRGSDAHKTVSR